MGGVELASRTPLDKSERETPLEGRRSSEMLFQKTASITAGSQFLGTEFKVAAPKGDRILIAKEIFLKMGSESKTYTISKVRTISGVTVKSVLKTDTSTDTDALLTGTDAGFTLFAGEQIQIETTSATAAMQAQIVFEEIDNSPSKARLDPAQTR